ncbi:MAG TPA: heme ABC exporter ATP-binding protein CcmA [Acidimicrobiia bacterium]|nr:heme ABC exporter ATP-binding protein CcmA [Acidimicrobiia bacterium]
MPAVHLRGAVTVLGRFPALAGLDLDVAQGEAVLISGPNGAGKSTLLRLLAGLVPLTAGTGNVFGHDLTGDRRALRKRVAFLGHETLCYGDLTAIENLRFHARAAGKPVSIADDAIERVGLTRVAGRPLRLLSAGQQRRVALGVVLAKDAPLLLLDEPHAGLDPVARGLLDSLVREVSLEGRTILMASHELARARGVTDREVRLAGGQSEGGTAEAPDDLESVVAR